MEKLKMSQPPIKAIPTDYRGTHFRSRLEAKWAAFFDLVGWPWQYEPIDLNGYIPDFVLPLYKPIVVEVKPELYLQQLFQHRKRIEDSGWDKEAMIVGADTFQNEFEDAAIGILWERHHERDVSGNWACSIFHKCTKCNSWSFHHEEWTWSCRVQGCYEGDHYLDKPEPETLRRLFAEASRIVQYNAD